MQRFVHFFKVTFRSKEIWDILLCVKIFFKILKTYRKSLRAPGFFINTPRDIFGLVAQIWGFIKNI